MIDELYRSLEHKLVSRNNYPVRVNRSSPPMGILVTASPDFRILGIPRFQETLDALKDFNNDVRLTFNYRMDQPEFEFSMQHCWKVKFVRAKSIWLVDEKIPSEQDLMYYILMAEKIAVLDNINQHIYLQTFEFNRRMGFENVLNQYRYLQVTDILNKNIQQDLLMDYPAVTLYAKSKGISLHDAATEIKFNTDNDMTFLSEFSAMRVKYEQLVKKETTIDNLMDIQKQFENQNTGYATFNA
jgi:hypothetical protein